jgi:hypothetical protein
MASGELTVDRLGAHTGATALRRLGLGPNDTAHYLVRPDGYIGFRAAGTDLAGLHAYLRRWLPTIDAQG